MVSLHNFSTEVLAEFVKLLTVRRPGADLATEESDDSAAVALSQAS